MADNSLRTLMDFRYKRKYQAENGQDGMKKKKFGKDGKNLIIKVPPGTVVIDEESGLVMKDLVEAGDSFVAAKGGKGGKGYVVASLGEDSGYVPYTAFSAKKSYIEKNKDVIQGFTDALQKGMDYVQTHTPEEIAKIIAPQFKETDLATITTIVTRYYEQETWKENLIFEKESFELLQNILESADELTKRAPYEELVTTDFAKKAAK